MVKQNNALLRTVVKQRRGCEFSTSSLPEDLKLPMSSMQDFQKVENMLYDKDMFKAMVSINEF